MICNKIKRITDKKQDRMVIVCLLAILGLSVFGCDSDETSSNLGDDTASGADGDTDADTDTAEVLLEEWPEGKDPETIGAKLAERFNASQVNLSQRHYKDACTWYGALQIARQTDNQTLMDSLIEKYAPALGTALSFIEESETPDGEVDMNVFGIVPLEIYKNNNSETHLQDGLALADQQIENIETHKRNAVDDMFMITGLQVQAYRASGDETYLNTAAATMVEYLNTLKPGGGCFYQLDNNTVKWGRGNGWFAVGMAEILQELENTHEHYDRILEGYEAMMSELLSYQTESGLWKQVIDHDGEENWEETSGSAMFTFAFVTGVKNGWLDAAKYAPAARKAWLALVDQLDEDGRLQNISNWCYFTTLEAYLTQKGRLAERIDAGNLKVTGDGHGQAPMLWSAAALMK